MTRLTRRAQKYLASVAILMVVVAAGVRGATALTYTSGDVLYVAYQSPGGANYIVDLGPRAQFLSASTTFTLTDVLASDLDGVVGAAAPDIFVGLFGVLNVTTRDGIVAANGPTNDFDLTNSSIAGAVSNIDTFGSGVQQYSAAVPSGNTNAGSFASSGSVGSYQSTLNANPLNPGKIADTLQWSVETRLSDAAGARNASPVKISFYIAEFNVFTGLTNRAVIGFFTLDPDGTLSYSPDADGDLIADEIDLCPGVASSDNSDVDGDLHAPACDCNPGDGSVWAIPGEVGDLTLASASALNWLAPGQPGGTALLYDVIEAIQSVSGTVPAYACLQSDLTGLSTTDATDPSAGNAFLYRVRAGNSCGEGTAGTQSDGQQVVAPACP